MNATPQLNEAAEGGSYPVPCSPSFSRFDESWKKETMKMTKSQIVDLLKRVCGDRDHAKDCTIEAMRIAEGHRDAAKNGGILCPCHTWTLPWESPENETSPSVDATEMKS